MYKVGVDLGGTNIVSGVIDEDYNIIGRSKIKTALPRSAESIFEDICRGIALACENAGITKDDIESIGIGTPGSVDKKNCIITYANNLKFDNVDAGALMAKSYPGVKIILENDANAAALGEALAGSGKGKNSFIAVTLGTGVGGGIVLGGKLLTGCNDAGGELGHMVIEFDGEECNCGRVGCWERYASATALINQTKRAMESNKDSKMWELCSGDIQKANGRTAFDAMRLGDEEAKKVVDTYINYVAIGTVNIVNIFQPEMICFGGGISNEKENLLKPLRVLVKESQYNKHTAINTELCIASLGNDAGIIGAALAQ